MECGHVVIFNTKNALNDLFVFYTNGDDFCYTLLSAECLNFRGLTW